MELGAHVAPSCKIFRVFYLGELTMGKSNMTDYVGQEPNV